MIDGCAFVGDHTKQNIFVQYKTFSNTYKSDHCDCISEGKKGVL